MHTYLFSSRRFSRCALIWLVLAVSSQFAFRANAESCPVPDGQPSIRYDADCWFRFELDVSLDAKSVSHSGGGAHGMLVGNAEASAARLVGSAADRSIGGAADVALSLTGSRYEEWHNMIGPNGAAGGKINMTVKGKGEGSITTHGAHSSGYGYMALTFDSNILGGETWKGSLSVAATTGVASSINANLPGPHGTSVQIPISSYSGIGNFPAVPFDLGTKRKKVCSDEWTYSSVSVVAGRLEANGNWLLLRLGQIEMCMRAYIRVKARLKCGCS